MIKKTLIFLAIVTVIFTVVSFVWWASIADRGHEYSGPMDDVRLAVYKGEFSSLLFIAEENGYFRNNGLNVIFKEYETGLAPVQSLLNGEVDFATAAEFVVVSNSFHGENIKILGTIDVADAISLVARKDSGIVTPRDLVGKKIATPFKTQAEFFLGKFLLEWQISREDVEIVNMSPGELVGAIGLGSVDAAMIWEPNVYNLINDLGKNAVVFPGQGLQDFLFLVVGDSAVINEYPHKTERLLRSLIDAEDFVRMNPQQSKLMMANRLGVEMGYIESAWNQNDFRITLPQGIFTVMEDEARWRIDNGIANGFGVPNYLNFINTEILKSIKPGAVNIIK